MNTSVVQQERASSTDFRPDLLSLRRRMLSLSQTELADAAGISQGTLSKIEQGLKEVTAPQIEVLARALNCPISFFTQKAREYGSPMSMHDGMFRKSASVGQKVIDRVIAELNVRIAHTNTLLSMVEVEPELPLPSYDTEDYEGDLEVIAQNVRRAWLMPRGPVKNLTEYLERAGCVIIKCDMNGAKIDGVSYRISNLPPLIFINNALPADRERFTLAHELGHIVLHRYPVPDMENEANKFASALLMPAADIAPDLQNLTIERAAALKPYWKVSMAALIYKAKSLGVIDEGKSQYLWRTMSTRGYRTREPESLNFANEQTSIFDALIKNIQEDLNYSEGELAAVLHLHFEELNSMYRIKKLPFLKAI